MFKGKSSVHAWFSFATFDYQRVCVGSSVDLLACNIQKGSLPLFSNLASWEIPELHEGLKGTKSSINGGDSINWVLQLRCISEFVRNNLTYHFEVHLCFLIEIPVSVHEIKLFLFKQFNGDCQLLKKTSCMFVPFFSLKFKISMNFCYLYKPQSIYTPSSWLSIHILINSLVLTGPCRTCLGRSAQGTRQATPWLFWIRT